MTRGIIAAIFGVSCTVFACLGTWFWLHGQQTLGVVMLVMIPSELGAFFLVSSVLSRRGQ